MHNIDFASIRTVGILVRGFLEDLQKTSRIAEYWGPHLCGGCAVGAYVTRALFKRMGHRSTFCIGQGEDYAHCWVELKMEGQDHVLDLTATQFDKSYPKIYFVPTSTYMSQFFVRGLEEFTRGHEAIRELPEWSEQERPDRYRHRIQKFLSTVKVPECIKVKQSEQPVLFGQGDKKISTKIYNDYPLERSA